ncbi:MAG: sodium-dependent transporter, partial [Clostridia bacterium]|nr:sodium-dependent transporter [Clostridia bacterium]
MASSNKSPETKSNGFTGKMGYVMAAAASAVGLGNIWRFPYLCAKYGGGIFLVIYLLLVFTFGYALLMSETAIGRMTGKSPIGAFKSFSNTKASSFGGWINALVPFIICP